jgi:hypothetical protein
MNQLENVIKILSISIIIHLKKSRENHEKSLTNLKMVFKILNIYMQYNRDNHWQAIV